MATIPTSYTPTDGAVFDVDGHNQNLYSATGSEGIYSESNGGLSSANLKAGFTILAEHIFPLSMVFAAERHSTSTLHYYSDLMGSASGNKYIVVDAVRFRLPFNAGQMKLVANFFMSPWLWYNGAAAAYMAGRTQIWFDGIAQPESEYLIPVAADGNAGDLEPQQPGRWAIQRNHHLLLTDSSLLTKGDHELSLRVHVDNTPAMPGSKVWPASTMDAPQNPILHGRVSFGAISIVALAYKKAN